MGLFDFLGEAGGGAMVGGLFQGIFGLFGASSQRKHEKEMMQAGTQEAQKARDWEVSMRNAQRPDWMKTPQWGQGMMAGADRRLALGNVGGETGWGKQDPGSYIGQSSIDDLRRKLALQSVGG